MLLPKDIDYTKYTSTSGMATKIWGSQLWTSLFTCVMGRYPIKIDKKNKEHLKVKRNFKSWLTSLDTIMPCIFCRNSFKIFLKELPIEKYLVGRIELMYWLYLMKDKVNKKLLAQEKKCYDDEKKRLKSLYKRGTLTKDEYYTNIDKFKNGSFITQPTPPFEQILDKYEMIRATCSKRAQACVLPAKKQ
jgi:hypothetical protein